MKKIIVSVFLLICCLSAHAAIARDGSCSAATTSCTLSAVATGDLVLTFAYRNASTTAPSLPASNTSVFVSTGGATNSFRVYCRVASSSGDTGTGTATNATGIVSVAYSGTSATTTAACATQGVAMGFIGAGSQQSGTSVTTATYSGLTTSSANTTSWIVGFMGDTVASDNCTPTGMTSVTSAGQTTVSDTNAAVATWAQVTCTITSATYRTFVLEVLAASPSCSSCAPAKIQTADCMEIFGASTSMTSGQFVNCEFGQPTQSSNAVLVGFSSSAIVIDFTITDNAAGKGNTYTCFQQTDGTNTQNWVWCIAPNAASLSQLKITANATVGLFALAAIEITNIATANPVDVTPVGNTASNASITSGSFTPATTGDFVCQGALQDGASTTTTFTVGSQANITWEFAAQDRSANGVMQCGTYASTSALNPTLAQSPTNNFVSLSIALKGASAGSTPTGMRILALKHWQLGTAVGGNFATSPRTDGFACPAASNLAYIAWMGGTASSDTLTAATINGSSMTQTGAAFNGTADSTSHNYYYQNASLGPNQTMVLTGSFGTASAVSYCLTGAATSAFQQTATNSGNAAGTGATLGPTISSFSPIGISGITFAQVGVALNTITGTTGSGNFHSCFWSGEAISSSGCDQNNGWVDLPFATNAAQSFSWNLVSSSTAVGAWASRADEFDAPSSKVCTMTLRGAGPC